MGAFLTFGLAPWGSTPPARADFGFDDLLDLLDPGWAAGAVDPTVPDAAADSGSFDLSALYDQFVYQPIHTAEQDWITSSFGEQVDTFLNTTWHEVGGTGILIGDGDPGTQADPTGGAGGLWFGDGGAGWDSTQSGVAGGGGGPDGGGGGGGGGLSLGVPGQSG